MQAHSLRPSGAVFSKLESWGTALPLDHHVALFLPEWLLAIATELFLVEKQSETEILLLSNTINYAKTIPSGSSRIVQSRRTASFFVPLPPLTMLPEWAVSLIMDLYCGAFPPSLPRSSRDGADNKNRIRFQGITFV